MNLKVLSIIGAATGAVLLIMALSLYFLFGEVKEANERLGAMTQALKTAEEVNKKNLEDFLASKEFTGLVDSLRVDRQQIINEISTRLDQHLGDYSRAREDDTEVRAWDATPVPAWIVKKNSREAQDAKSK